ncbi:MAG: PhoH family protein [Thermoguttaceae bacterium]|nr:PhoH family protein [Thermoguttaceae bacterium]
MKETYVPIPDTRVLGKVFGPSDEHLRTIRRALNLRVTVDGGRILLRSEDDRALKDGAELLAQLQTMASRRGEIISNDDVRRAISEIRHQQPVSESRPIEVYGGKRIGPRTAGQAAFLTLLRSKTVLFCTGPAGCGKTYLAVARAVELLRSGDIRKIVLVRPAVEAGENLGFLPGDLRDKINPYLRPLFDALADMIPPETLAHYMQEDRIEVIPLAYMRGRTLNNAAIILDEAQNTTVAQMKMFLTRMGEGVRITVCGDATQTDLSPHKKSGLTDAVGRLNGIKGIGHIELTADDIVRHDLVQKIVHAYEENPDGQT